MDNCDVCCEKFNKINHKKVKCPFCDLNSCRTCSQRYILESTQDPHCMGCKTLWNREFVDSFCTKSFRNIEFKKRRENVLFERQKLLMPETQPEVERILQMRNLRRVLQKQKTCLLELHHKYKTSMSFTDNGSPPRVHPEILVLYREMEQTYRTLEQLRTQGTGIEGEPRRFVRKCPVDTCKGFLNEEWYCGLCQVKYCNGCNEPLTDQHICDPDVVKTMKLLNRDSKSCPKCGIVIHKTSGCAQMWCISCHTAFNWRTGEIETGRIHNPHFIEFKKKTMTSREHGDIPCGGTPTFRELRQINSTNEILQCAMNVDQMERNHLYIILDPIDYTPMRIAYMLNDIDEPTFKTYLQRVEKFRDKSRDMSDIYEMIANAGGDLLRQYVINPDREAEIVATLHELFAYGNEIFETIRNRYNCKYPYNINI